MKYSTDDERARAERREAIADRLKNGETYRQIEDDLRTSSRTIAKVSKLMKENEHES